MRDRSAAVSKRRVSISWSKEERAEIVAWFQKNEPTLPEPVRRMMVEPLENLAAPDLPSKLFNLYSRQLAMALGLIPSSERQRKHSGSPLSVVRGKPGDSTSATAGAGNDAERSPAEAKALASETRCASGMNHLERKTGETRSMGDESKTGSTSDSASSEKADAAATEKPLSKEKLAAIAAESVAFAARAQLGNGEDPALASETETLMNADVVCVEEDIEIVPAVLPEGVDAGAVVKKLIDSRVRYDFAVTVTKLQLEVEKKVIVTKDGQRRVICGDTHEYGPKGFAVTWQALATLAVMVGQFAMPLNRLGTMLSTATKKFTSTSLFRMTHYVAERLAPIYLVLMEQLADSDILAGDDTSCRVLEVSKYYAGAREGPPALVEQSIPKEPSPWRSYVTTSAANKTFLEFESRREELLKSRADGEREAKKTPVKKTPLKVLVGRELDFESPRKNGDGPKQSFNTTVVTGRVDAAEPSSQVVFYRSHLGSLGNLLEMLLSRRHASKRKLTIQADLSTTNLVTDPKLTSRMDIKLVGCAAHARRPFAQYEDQDPKHAAVVLALFGMLAIHEEELDRHGRNRENTLAVRGTDSRKMWERLKLACLEMAERWTKATPLGTAARYLLKHYERLTAYLSNPYLQATNNMRERLLRTEKLIERSSMFRRSIEGRVVLDILRTLMQTAVAAGAGPHEYLVDVLKADPADIEENPAQYTPAAWLKRQQQEYEAELAADAKSAA